MAPPLDWLAAWRLVVDRFESTLYRPFDCQDQSYWRQRLLAQVIRSSSRFHNQDLVAAMFAPRSHFAALLLAVLAAVSVQAQLETTVDDL